ncbi:protein phyllopod [Drosophila pseudoobscura]|uniref:Protein phyllopod n=1 Tax=Drosophila pseudoobscura pseudoobscura TaxID=46245 RepID=A0A6I8VSZ8_DROPS|nr:protein phyllopod [Drosophila pseudoobscura]
MSANNHHQVEPAAAVATAQKSASSEYLKRTCLICGCHTNQTINIYEPRSGPNIVQLIQAKFKFQPLNEDKFLCFSCNNWLINWHSLQALNSNDADSQSQSPSAQMGNNSSGSLLPEERARRMGRPVAYVQPQVRVNPRSQPLVRVQPQPQPQQLRVRVQPQPQPQPQFQQQNLVRIQPQAQFQQQPHIRVQPQALFPQHPQPQPQQARVRVQPQSQPRIRAQSRVRVQPRLRGPNQSQLRNNVNLAPAAITYRKRSSSRGFGSVDGMSKILRQCYLESVKFWSQPKKITQQSLNDHLRQFQEKSNLLGKVQGVAPRRKPAVVAMERPAAGATAHQLANEDTLPPAPAAAPDAAPAPTSAPSPAHQRFAQPSVDGKVVAMFRRLGTTLSRESSMDGEASESSAPTTSTASPPSRPPQIMSPSKQRPRWTRTLDDDEVLLEFDSVISEVLPAPVASSLTTSPPPTTARRCLSYPITNEREEDEDGQGPANELEEMEVLQEQEVQLELDEEEEPQSHDEESSVEISHQASLEHSGLRLPRGLSISLI